EGEEAFARFQSLMVAQARDKSYDILDIQVRRLTDINNQNHTRNLLQSVEIKDRGSKEERYIVLDLNYLKSYINILMQVRIDILLLCCCLKHFRFLRDYTSQV
ncbi:unnamed protein product, partial [Adineta steineri]